MSKKIMEQELYMAKYTELNLILTDSEIEKLEQKARLETRSARDQARHILRLALGLAVATPHPQQPDQPEKPCPPIQGGGGL